MCTLITFATPLADPPQPEGPLRVGQFINKGSGHVYRTGLHVFTITLNGCSCGLIRSGSDWEGNATRAEQLRKRYEKKGWSAVKIQRALRDAESVLNRPGNEGFDRRVVSYFSELLRLAPELQFIAHEHSALFSDEPFEILSTIELQSLGDGRSFIPQDDIRYTLRSSPP